MTRPCRHKSRKLLRARERSRLTSAIAAIVVVASAATARGVPATHTLSQRSSAPSARRVLKNGLVVIAVQDSLSSAAHVRIVVRAGARDEYPSPSGSAHLLEHLMFEASARVPAGAYGRFVHGAGGTYGATTAADRTTYVTVVPAQMLDSLLWMESDRFGGSGRAFESSAMRQQQAVVNAERRSRIDAVPSALIEEALWQSVFSPPHPYHSSPIASIDRTNAVSLVDVRLMFRMWYVPNNMVIGIRGPLDTAATLRLVEKHFGRIARGREVRRRDARPPVLARTVRLVMEHPDAGELQPHLRLAWPIPGTGSSDWPALRRLPRVLADREDGLLARAVIEGGFASNVTASTIARERAGLFELRLYPATGISLSTLERIADSLINGAQDGPAAVVLTRAATSLSRPPQVDPESTDLEALIDLELRGASESAGDVAAGRIPPSDSQHVARVFRRFLGERPVVLSVVPKGRFDLAASPARPYSILLGSGKD